MQRDAVIVICTRPQSERFPNKVFKSIVGLPAIEHLLKRIVPSGLPIVLAIPYHCTAYHHLQKKFGVTIFEGDPKSPLHRMASAIRMRPEKWIVRITHDDILIDSQSMLELIDKCASTPNCGYGITPEIVDGSGVEVIHRENLLSAAKNRSTPTEFVSYFVKSEPHSIQVIHQPRKSICRPYRLTMDYYDDFLVLEAVLRTVGVNASLDTIVDCLDKNNYLMRSNHLPETTIYTCAFNAEDYIEQTMETILAQPFYKDFEYIFIDDGSTDSTLQKAMRFNHDMRLRYFANEGNIGLANSSNLALNKARGKYVFRVDADDVIFHEAIPKMIATAQQAHSPVVYSGYREMSEDGTILSDMQDPRLNHHAGCALMDRRMINEIRFADDLRHWDSYDLFERIKSRFNIVYVDEPLWLYRLHPKSLSHSNLSERAEIMDHLSDSYA